MSSPLFGLNSYNAQKKENLPYPGWQNNADRKFVSTLLCLAMSVDKSDLLPLFASSVSIKVCLTTLVPISQKTIQQKTIPQKFALCKMYLHFLLTYCTIKRIFKSSCL